MAVKIYSAAVLGLEAEIVEVEADLGGGQMGSFATVGLPDLAVNEAREARLKTHKLTFRMLK